MTSNRPPGQSIRWVAALEEEARRELVGQAIIVLARPQGQQADQRWQVVLTINRQLEVERDCCWDPLVH